jgi:hypothetical protein
LKKSNQKTFVLRALAPLSAPPAGIKSFLLLFFKKEALAFVSEASVIFWPLEIRQRAGCAGG